MNKLFFFFVLLLFSSNMLAQPYPEITIMDIQYQHPDSLLANGDKPSPYNGDTVTVTGVVMVAPYRNADPDSNVVLIAGVPALYLQDTTQTDWAGIIVRHPSSTAAFDILDTGTVIKVTGWVDEFSGATTQLNAINFDASGVLGFRDREVPVLLTLDSLAEFGQFEGKVLAERWEGVLVEVRNVTAVSEIPAPIGQGFFYVYDQNNTKVYIGNQSSYFRNNAARPPTGSTLDYVRGYIQNRINVGGNQYINIIMPAYPGDVKIASFFPSVSDITRNPVEVGYGVPVTINANIVDSLGFVTEAKLFYRKNMGANNEVTMTNTSANTWEAVIPAQNDSSLIDFFIRAVDNDNNVSIFPADTTRSRYFYLVLNRPLTIQDVQYSPFGSGFSGYNSYQVTVRGIVTADSSDVKGYGSSSPARNYMQLGEGPWSGIQISFGGSVGTTLYGLSRRGDDLTITGTIQESFGVTRINNISAYTINSIGNPLPAPHVLTTGEIGTLGDGEVAKEKWESVLVAYQNPEITNINADGGSNYGEMYVNDGSGDTRVELEDGNNSYQNGSGEPGTILIEQGASFDELIGIMYYSFSNYKLIPRKDDDFVNYTTDVSDDKIILTEYSLAQNYPNPFNPSTRIEYSLPVEGSVTFKIFNILGQEVRTLINNELMSAGRHIVTFEASSLPSGIYIYRLQTGNYSSNKKMILLK